MNIKVVVIDPASKTYSGLWHWDRADAPSSPYMEESAAIAAGYTKAPIVDPAPSEVQAWKVKMVLRKRGRFAAMQAGIDALTGPNALLVQSRWEFGGTLPRDGETVNELCLTALGYTPAQTDDLFREADRIPD